MQARAMTKTRISDRDGGCMEGVLLNRPTMYPKMSFETTAIACGNYASDTFPFTIVQRRTTLSQGIPSIGASRIETIFTREGVMKVRVILLCAALAGSLCSAIPAAAQDATGTKTATKKEAKWQGHVVRVDT